MNGIDKTAICETCDVILSVYYNKEDYAYFGGDLELILWYSDESLINLAYDGYYRVIKCPVTDTECCYDIYKVTSGWAKFSGTCCNNDCTDCLPITTTTTTSNLTTTTTTPITTTTTTSQPTTTTTTTPGITTTTTTTCIQPTIQEIAFPGYPNAETCYSIFVSTYVFEYPNGCPIVERGIVYSLYPNPTIMDYKILQESIAGEITTEVAPLQSNTGYYFCGYVISSAGVQYLCYPNKIYTQSDCPTTTTTTLPTTTTTTTIGTTTTTTSGPTTTSTTTYNPHEWFLPSLQETLWMNYNLYTELGNGAEPPGTFIYLTSSEYDASNIWYEYSYSPYYDRVKKTKSDITRVVACRTFNSSTLYNQGDTGPKGGWIFFPNYTNTRWSNGDGTYLYYECQHIIWRVEWSNVHNTLVGGTSVNGGTGKANTLLIISQPGHTNSAALRCYNYNP